MRPVVVSRVGKGLCVTLTKHFKQLIITYGKLFILGIL
jgi:hypothetical protein